MRRRELIALLGGAAAWPFAAHAQRMSIPIVGYLHAGSGSVPRDLTAFRRGLSEAGYAEGSDVIVEYRFAHGRHEQLRALAADLVDRQVAAIFTTGGVAPAQAAKEATSSIPIVFAHGSDPVETGLVASLNRPGANITGVTFITGVLPAKTLELLREVAPTARVVGLLMNAKSTTREARADDVRAAADSLGIHLKTVSAGGPHELDAAFSKFAEDRINTVLVIADPLFRNHYQLIASLSRRYSIALMTFARDFVEAGALMSYGTDIANSYQQAGVYVGRILSGTRPSDLPILQPTKFELVINLKTAKALGLDVPATLLARADEVIE